MPKGMGYPTSGHTKSNSPSKSSGNSKGSMSNSNISSRVPGTDKPILIQKSGATISGKTVIR